MSLLYFLVLSRNVCQQIGKYLENTNKKNNPCGLLLNLNRNLRIKLLLKIWRKINTTYCERIILKMHDHTWWKFIYQNKKFLFVLWKKINIVKLFNRIWKGKNTCQHNYGCLNVSVRMLYIQLLHRWFQTCLLPLKHPDNCPRWCQSHLQIGNIKIRADIKEESKSDIHVIINIKYVTLQFTPNHSTDRLIIRYKWIDKVS